MKKSFLGVALMISVLALSAFSQDPSAKAAETVSGPKQIRGGILNGKAVSLPRPEYPADARAAGLHGTVFVDVVIDESGTVISAIAATEPRDAKSKVGDNDIAAGGEIEPADPILREAAEKAGLEAKFSPTRLSGNPVKVSGTIVYKFALEQSSIIEPAVLNGKAISLPVPDYPRAAMAVRAEGTIVVKVTIDENGVVIEAEAVSGHP